MSTATDSRPTRAAPSRHRAMVVDKPVLPAHQDLSRGILPTEIRPAVARGMVVGFLLLIFAVPVVQVAFELVLDRDIQALTLFTRYPTRGNLDRYEKDLSRQSVARQRVQPWLQLALTRYLGFGTTSVLRGRDGWLFYRPGVDVLTGRGLLDARARHFGRRSFAPSEAVVRPWRMDSVA